MFLQKIIISILTSMQSTGTTIKKSSFQSLKQAKQQFSKEIRMRSKQMKKYKFLKDEIYNNHNIFQSLTNINQFSKTMTAQNIIWKKNYQLKQGINALKQQNSSLKARIWNVQKDNRKMDRQIESWGLKKTFANNSSKPYIDSATAEKVLDDQDYSITSIKIQIMQLQYDLMKLTNSFQQSLTLNKNVKNIKNDLNHQICTKKVQLYEWNLCTDDGEYRNQDITMMRNQKRQILITRNTELQIVNKNAQLKKKSKSVLEDELTKINAQMQNLSQITREKIISLKLQAHKLRTQDESYVNEEVKKLANVKQKYLHFECKTQDKMGEFIKRKIQIEKEINKYQRKTQKIQQQQRIIKENTKKTKCVKIHMK